MAYLSDWVIGSVKGGAYSLTVNASAAAINGSRYLYHPTDALSLLAGMAAAMTAGGVAAPAAFLTRDRKVRLTGGANFSITWGASTALRNLLGFSGDLSGASAYTAPGTSALLWSPAKPLRPELSPLGTLGLRTPLAYFTMSPSDGSTFVASHGSRIDQRFTCGMVAVDRVYPADQAGGSWVAFFDQVAAVGASFYVYRDATEEAGSTTAATLSAGLGPYVLLPSGRAPSWRYNRSRGFDWCDKRADVDFSARVVPEYT